MGVDWQRISERTWQVIESAVPRRFDRDSCCFLWAAVLAEGMKPHGGKMVAGGASLPGQVTMTWGVVHNPAARTFYLTADDSVDENGEYCGHCWVELPDWDPVVVDAMSKYSGARQIAETGVVYHPKPSLLRSIKRHFKAEIAAVRKAVKKDAEYQKMCAELAAQTR